MLGKKWIRKNRTLRWPLFLTNMCRKLVVTTVPGNTTAKTDFPRVKNYELSEEVPVPIAIATIQGNSPFMAKILSEENLSIEFSKGSQIACILQRTLVGVGDRE